MDCAGAGVWKLKEELEAPKAFADWLPNREGCAPKAGVDAPKAGAEAELPKAGVELPKPKPEKVEVAGELAPNEKAICQNSLVLRRDPQSQARGKWAYSSDEDA